MIVLHVNGLKQMPMKSQSPRIDYSRSNSQVLQLTVCVMLVAKVKRGWNFEGKWIGDTRKSKDSVSQSDTADAAHNFLLPRV